VEIKNLSRRQFFYHCASGDEAAPMKMSLREEQSIAGGCRITQSRADMMPYIAARL
jgi:hypothetical protein